jgi:hypothetical protein
MVHFPWRDDRIRVDGQGRLEGASGVLATTARLVHASINVGRRYLLKCAVR